MAMLLRTRKQNIALCLRIISLLTVTISFVVFSVVSRGKSDGEVVEAEGISTNRIARHLMTLNDSQQHEYVQSQNCTPAAINEFPWDHLTKEQRQNGWIILHVVIACYLFILLAVVCDDYFVPAIKNFCDNFQMKTDIAGATFMATASSSPELFVNCIGTFVTQGDIGVGTIVGSAVFNVLAVPACCGLFARMVLELEWWPLTRDSIMYGLSVVALIVVLEDGRVYFSEALTLVLMYSLYILLMCFNEKLKGLAYKYMVKFHKRKNYVDVLSETHPLLIRQDNQKANGFHKLLESVEVSLKDCEDLGESTEIWKWPSEESKKGKIWWVLTWPISFVLYITTPDCRKYPKLCIITFIMCIVWIGVTSYMVAWLITIIGDTLDIPDSVMGLTFLAAGTSVPEAVSSVIVAKEGHGNMGISSSIGSNTFDILLCLGIPWLIKTCMLAQQSQTQWIQINSMGISYCATALLSTLFILYLSIALNEFKLNWRVGLTCLVMYAAFLIFASLIELNVFFPVNLPTCAS